MKHSLLALLIAALPVAAQNVAPDPEIQVSCGTLSGEGKVRLVIGDRVVLGPFVIRCGERA